MKAARVARTIFATDIGYVGEINELLIDQRGEWKTEKTKTKSALNAECSTTKNTETRTTV